MKKLFYNAKIVGEDGLLPESSMLVEDGVIIGFGDNDADEKIDCGGKYLLAGFIDIHVHGGGGADFMDGSVEGIETAVSTHLAHGTTTIFPTTMSAEMQEIENVFKLYRQVKEGKRVKANLGGLHLEGPFISPKMCGAQRLDLIVLPTKNEIELLKENADIIARITCAPEVDGVMEMAKALLPLGISFSMGHTMATYEQAEAAFENGFSAITHLYSATSGFHKVNQKVHIGVTQAAYGIEGIYAELIGDGCHVPKQLLRLVTKFKGVDKVCLVTDAMRAAGTDLTESYLGKICPENRVIIEDGVAKLPDRSFFAGSIGTMDRAFKFAIQNAELPLQTASKLVSLTPAKLMGISAKKGSIAIGKDADFVLLDDEFNVKKVYVNAQEVA
jgi:N-acetylglucosamine-6-phosphate deacetylase